MANPLAPFFNRVPTHDELTRVASDELARIIEAAKAAECLDVADLRETQAWARDVRTAAERALEARQQCS